MGDRTPYAIPDSVPATAGDTLQLVGTKWVAAGGTGGRSPYEIPQIIQATKGDQLYFDGLKWVGHGGTGGDRGYYVIPSIVNATAGDVLTFDGSSWSGATGTPAPTVSSVTNASGPWRATANTLIGTNFAAGGSLAVDLSTDDGSTWHACTSVSVTDSSHVAFTTPVQTANVDGAHTRIRFTNGDGQTATLGAGNYWVVADPKDFSGFVGEYEADNLTLSGANVTTWPDGSGAGNDLPAPGTNPQKVAAGSLALPYVQFNGSSDYVKIASMSFGGAGNLSCLALMRIRSGSTTVPVSYNSLSAAFVYDGTNMGLWRGSPAAQSPTHPIATRWLRHFGVFRAAGTEEIWTDEGLPVSSSIGGSITTSGVAFSLGARTDGALPAAVDMAAALVFNTDQTANQIPISEYLRIKYWGGVGAPIQEIDTPGGVANEALDATKIVSFGELDVESTLVAGFDSGGTISGDLYVFGATSSEGAMSLRYSQVAGSHGSFILTVRGSDVLTLADIGFFTGDNLYFRCWYRQSTNSCCIRIGVNGSYQEISAASTGDALVAPTVAKLGLDSSGANGFTASYTKFIARRGADLAVFAPEFIHIGDSISTGYHYCRPPAAWLYAVGTSVGKPGCANLAISGGQIPTQQANFDASEEKGKASVKAVIIYVGINDIINLLYTTTAAFIAAYQGLVNDIRAAHPSAKIYAVQLSPTSSVSGATHTLWQNVNIALAGGGGTPITGVDRCISSHVATLNDGSDGLLAMYSIDGLHPNDAGREVIGLAIRTGLLADGLVT